jgi:hypothetical protein
MWSVVSVSLQLRHGVDGHAAGVPLGDVLST